MNDENKIILSVPCKIKFTAVVENSAKLLTPLLKGMVEDDFELNLKMILNEAYVNVLKHCNPKPEYLAKIVYTIHSDRIEFDIYDPGQGLKVANHLPPYPDTIQRTTQPVFKMLDGCVMAHIIDHSTLSLTFKDEGDVEIERDEYIRTAKPGGLGIPIMTKLMDDVKFRYLGDEGQVLNMVKLLRRR